MERMLSPTEPLRIKRCYDSHVHWLGTGEILNIIDLSTIQSLSDLKAKAKDWKSPNRGEWIIGFGWDQSQWKDSFVPHHQILDQLFPSHPVSFIRADGHCSWVNSLALRAAGIVDGWVPMIPSGGRIEVDAQGAPTGLFIDMAKDLMDQAIPPLSRHEVKARMLQGMEIFYQAGFTHIRDVGGSLRDWEIATEILQENQLKLYVEMLFNLDNFSQLSERISELVDKGKQTLPALRVGGLKLYYDGALGSEGALLSQNYSGSQNCGLRLLEVSQVEEVLHRCWEKKVAVAIHTLGDEAVHQVVQVANRLKERGVEGILNLEHCEVIRDETIQQMRALNICCHMQPSHFLSDRRWLKTKLGSLYSFCFPWKKLIEAGVAVCFGSDSPIERPSLAQTLLALNQAQQEGIAMPGRSVESLHSHPDVDWGAGCETQFTGDGRVLKIIR